MIEAYVLIQAKPGRAGQGVSKEVSSAEDVSGPYDVIARAQAFDANLAAWKLATLQDEGSEE